MITVHKRHHVHMEEGRFTILTVLFRTSYSKSC